MSLEVVERGEVASIIGFQSQQACIQILVLEVNLGLLACLLSSGFLAINGLLLAGHISGNLASFLWAEDVGADRDDLFESSDDIGLNHTLVQFDLVPLELAFLGSLDVKPSLHNRRINRPHSVLG